MWVRVRKDARSHYVGMERNLVNWKWADMLEKVQGMWIEVETDYLFLDQYNTVPVPGVSNNGLRLMDRDIDGIYGDVRPERVQCLGCNRAVKPTHPIEGMSVCTCECGHLEKYGTAPLVKEWHRSIDVDSETFQREMEAQSWKGRG